MPRFVLRARLLLAVVPAALLTSFASCAAPRAETAPVIVGTETLPAAEWAAVLRVLIGRDPEEVLPLLVIPATTPQPANAAALDSAGRQLQAEGLVGEVCSVPANNRVCPSDQSRSRYDVGRVRVTSDSTVHVHIAWGWQMAPGDTTMASGARRGMCFSAAHGLRRRAGTWKRVGTRTLAVC